jgi:hypothetical protein
LATYYYKDGEDYCSSESKSMYQHGAPSLIQLH